MEPSSSRDTSVGDITSGLEVITINIELFIHIQL